MGGFISYKAYIFFCICLFGYIQNSFAGAWLLDKGESQLISSFIIDRAQRSYGPDFPVSDPEFFKAESLLYIERGWRPKINLIGSFAVQNVSFKSGDERNDFQGFGAISAGLRYQIKKTHRDVLSAEIHGIVIGGGEEIPDGDLGRGNLAVESRLLYGRGFDLLGRHAFIDQQIGYRFRTSNINLFLSDTTLGVNVTPKILMLIQGFYNQNQGDLTNNEDIIFPNKAYKLQTSLVYKVNEKYRLQAGGFKTIFGENIIDEEALLFGGWTKF